MKHGIAVGLLLMGGVAAVSIAIWIANWQVGVLGMVVFGLGIIVSSEDW